jgi:hypothetical protein
MVRAIDFFADGQAALEVGAGVPQLPQAQLGLAQITEGLGDLGMPWAVSRLADSQDAFTGSAGCPHCPDAER